MALRIGSKSAALLWTKRIFRYQSGGRYDSTETPPGKPLLARLVRMMRPTGGVGGSGNNAHDLARYNSHRLIERPDPSECAEIDDACRFHTLSLFVGATSPQETEAPNSLQNVTAET
ncbi:MAG: hypothetical protein ABSH31_01790 [Bryobacteraceae bacterium]|jgi:hypothetical protein